MNAVIRILVVAFAAFAIGVVLGIFLLKWPTQTVIVSAAISAIVSASILLIQRT